MKQASLAVVTLLTCTMAVPTLAQGQRAERPNRRAGARIIVAQLPVELLQGVCKLTPDQVTKIKGIQAKLAEDLRALRPQRGAPQDPAAAQKRRELIEQANKEILALLTDEQKEAVRKAAPELAVLRALDIPLQVVADLKLTEEQKQKLAQIAKELREKVAGLPQEERRSKMRELTQEARQKAEAVLTAEQKATITKFREEHRQKAGRRRQSPPAA